MFAEDARDWMGAEGASMGDEGPVHVQPGISVIAPDEIASRNGPLHRLGAGRSLDEYLSGIERGEIHSALERARGSRTLAARFLGISRSRLYRRMIALGIESNEPKTGEPT
jgi:DNA-binding NtrC family response regulator